MAKKLSPIFVDLTQDTLLKVFWYKNSLRLFLQQQNISNDILAQWHSDQTKRDFVTFVFTQLVNDEKGQNAILSIARYLADMKHFTDLERKEDSKIAIQEAKKAVARLREEVIAINETIRETKDAELRRKTAQEQMVAHAVAQQSIEKLQEKLTGLMPKLGTQSGGYDFERWFYELAVFFELESRPGYKADGRQIDGAITIEGTTFLIEAKFTEKPIGSPDIDTFMAKIDSKADNTMGIMISMSGFNDGAIHSASKNKTPMLLLDHGHIYNLILRGIMTLPQVVSRVKRHASQTGISFLAADKF